MVNPTDSVSIFSEGTFQEQFSELVDFVARSRPEDERSRFISSFKDELKTTQGQKPLAEDVDRRRTVLLKLLKEIGQLGEGNEKEIEGFFNLLFSHLFTLFDLKSEDTKEQLDHLLQTISSSPSEKTAVKYRILSNLFNAIPYTSSLRLAVYNVILNFAASNGDLDTLQLSRATVEKWLSEWQISSGEKCAFLKTLSDVFNKAGQLTTAYEYSLSYVRALPQGSQEAQSAALEVIATALRLPNMFDLDPLFKLDAVIALRGHELFSLLQVFLSGGLLEFRQWQASHAGAVEEYGLDATQLERKIRLLSLASLGFKNIGQDLPYAKIAENLQIDVSEVEKWVIDVIRAGLLWGKLSQTTQSLYIMRSSVRTFEKEEWEILEKRILAWKSGLAEVLEVITNAKRMAGHHPVQPPATASA